MTKVRALLSVLMLILLPSLVFAARHQAVPLLINGTVLSAETNRPTSGVPVTFFARGKQMDVTRPVASATSDANGKFSVTLGAGSYTWTAKADGFGLSEGNTTIVPGQPATVTVYLRREAKITGRLVDGNAKAMAGVPIGFGRWAGTATGADGGFSVRGLDSRGYEPKILKPGWVLEKNAYVYLSPGETKDLGNVIMRRAGSVKVMLRPVNNSAGRPLNRVSLGLSGNDLYRSSNSGGQGFALFEQLPPGHYSVSASDERLNGATREFDLAEGENITVTLEPEIKPPSLGIEEYGDVFLPDKPVKLRAHGLWVAKAEARISRVDSDQLLRGMVSLSKPDAIQAGLLRQLSSIPVTFRPRRDGYTRNARIPVPALQPGAYLLDLTGNGATARFGFLVTRLGLVAKKSPESTILFATDLVSGRALQGVTIRTPKGDARVTTGTDGMAVWNASARESLLVGRSGDSLAFLELGTGEEHRKKAGHKAYIYTDRPAYRPGQTVYFKGVLRQRDGEGYSLPSLRTVHVTISDDGDKTVCEQDTAVSATGSFQGECVLTAGSALGGYTINASANEESWQGWFKVLEYRKPEYEVKLVPDRRFLVSGDTATVRLNARYYFGAAVARGKVSWRIYSQPAWGLGGDDDSGRNEDGEDRDSGGYSDFIAEGETTLDGNGEAMIPVVAKNHDMPCTYTLEADVTDVSSRQVSSSSSLTVVPSLVSLDVKTGSYLSKPGALVDIFLKSGTWEGEPRSLPVTLEFERQYFDRKSGTSSWKKFASSSLKTGPDGAARTTYNFPVPGYWQVSARTTDPAGRAAVSTDSIWVWKEGYGWEGSYRELEAEFDRKIYKTGETARLIVRSPGAGGTLLLTLEGRDIKSRRSIPLKGLVEVVEIPVIDSYAPFIHVSAITVRNGRFFSRTLPLRVDLRPSRLDLRVKADKPVYAPGDRVKLSISSASSDQPVPAELSLAVVDEAIFGVASERKDDIYRFFRGDREHLVNTLHSFPRVYLGGAAKDKVALAAKDDDLKGLKLRKTFKDTAYWQPMLTTKPDGSASAEFTLPDNLTTWRATAVGHTATSEFGAGREKFIARLELMARLSPPRFLTVGDELKIPGVITSMSDKPQTARGRFEADGLTLLEEGTFSGDILPRGTLRRDMPLRADTRGMATLRLLAKGVETGDAMELTLPVLARGVFRTTGGGIALREQEGTTVLNLPDNALAGSPVMKLSIAPTIATSLTGAIAQLVQFPYGCVEQTLSRFIPAVHARALLAGNAWQPDPATTGKLPLVIEEGLKRLEEMQHDDGGWGWWKQDSTSLTMTSHALYGLGLAKRSGLEIPAQMLQKGLQALETLVRTAPADELPRACRALVINGRRNGEIETKIRSAWNKLATADRLAFCEALDYAGAGDEFSPLLEELKRDVRDEGTASYIMDRDAESWWYGWRWGSSAVETTSSMLSLVVKRNPNDPLAARLAEFLARRRNGGWWQTTTSSAAAVKALADYVAATGEAGGEYTASLSLNGTELASYRVESGKIVSGDRDLTIPATGLKNGSNSVRLRKSGDGAAYLSASLEYAVPPGSTLSSPGLKLQRTMYRIYSVRNGNAWRREYVPLKPGETLATGDDIEVRLIVENDRALEYVIIEDRLPAGFESREADRDPRFMDDSGFFDWYSHRERRDERVAFFIDALPAGRHEFRHVIYPELEGRIIALPAAVWPMYQPEMRGESQPWQVEVGKR